MQRSREAKQIISTRHTRSYRIPDLESVRLDTIRKYFRECMQTYGEGKFGGADVKSAVHLYIIVFGNFSCSVDIFVL